ncbi:hypothetical protein G5B10_14855 [Fluviicola sp. SGL-29]|nr:hypothetical protein [Fluviicola sp. SGL-29]
MINKRTDIPKDWSFTKLGNLGQFLKGKGIAKSEVIEDGIPCVRYGEIYTNHNDYIKAFTSFTSQESANQSTRLEYGDILFAGSGETLEDIGKSVAFVDEFEAYSGGDIIILRGHNQDPKFLGFLLNTDFVSRQTFQLGQGHSVVHIYSSGLKNVKVILPPLPEQQKIAAILSTWDKAIDKLTQLIAAKEQRKKGLMQVLLTGKKRFAGFKDEWKEVKLGEVGEIVNGLTYSPKDVVEKGLLVLRSSNIQNEQLSFHDNVYVKSDNTVFNPIKENDVLICVRNGSRNLIGKNVMIPKELEGVAFGAFMTVYRSQYNEYIGQVFNSDIFKKSVHMNLGATINSINNNDLKKYKIPFPTIQEQQKIASVLSAADKEIELLKKELESLLQQKKGLMQVLLTGEVRVKI